MHPRVVAARREKAIDRIADGISRLGGHGETIHVKDRRRTLEELFTLEAVAIALDAILAQVGMDASSSPREKKPESEPDPVQAKPIGEYSKAELVNIAKSLGLPSSGTKDDLIERIQQHLHPVVEDDAGDPETAGDTPEGDDGSSDDDGDAEE